MLKVTSTLRGENNSEFVQNTSTVGPHKELLAVLARNALVLQMLSRGFDFLFCTFASGPLDYQGPYYYCLKFWLNYWLTVWSQPLAGSLWDVRQEKLTSPHHPFLRWDDGKPPQGLKPAPVTSFRLLYFVALGRRCSALGSFHGVLPPAFLGTSLKREKILCKLAGCTLNVQPANLHK